MVCAKNIKHNSGKKPDMIYTDFSTKCFVIQVILLYDIYIYIMSLFPLSLSTEVEDFTWTEQHISILRCGSVEISNDFINFLKSVLDGRD